MVDMSTGSFTMYGARNAIAGGLGHIEEQVQAIERAVTENPGLAFDLAKTLIECICRWILRERSIPFDERANLPSLFRTVSRTISFLPVEASTETEIRRSLDKTLNGLHTTVQGVTELRNKCGFASHGSDRARPSMESVQALLAAQAADTIVGFLYRAHCQDQRRTTSMLPEYDINQEFNDYIDDLYGIIHILDAEFRPSEVLFRMEPETYRIYLTEFNNARSKTAESVETAETPEEEEE